MTSAAQNLFARKIVNAHQPPQTMLPPPPCSFFKWATPGLFCFIFVFSLQLTVNKCTYKFVDGWIQTADLWCRKRWLYQLSHNHPAVLFPCPFNCPFLKLMQRSHWCVLRSTLARFIKYQAYFCFPEPQQLTQINGKSVF